MGGGGVILRRSVLIPIFVKQNAATPKNKVEFCQKSIGVIRCSLATLYDDVRRHTMSPKVLCQKQTDKRRHV